jgi:hypothetical protein
MVPEKHASDFCDNLTILYYYMQKYGCKFAWLVQSQEVKHVLLIIGNAKIAEQTAR